jgi:hypothetical protein
VGPRADVNMCGKSRPTGIRFPDRPACIESLYRLCYPDPILILTLEVQGGALENLGAQCFSDLFIGSSTHDQEIVRYPRNLICGVPWNQFVLRYVLPYGRTLYSNARDASQHHYKR